MGIVDYNSLLVFVLLASALGVPEAIACGPLVFPRYTFQLQTVEIWDKDTCRRRAALGPLFLTEGSAFFGRTGGKPNSEVAATADLQNREAVLKASTFSLLKGHVCDVWMCDVIEKGQEDCLPCAQVDALPEWFLDITCKLGVLSGSITWAVWSVLRASQGEAEGSEGEVRVRAVEIPEIFAEHHSFEVAQARWRWWDIDRA